MNQDQAKHEAAQTIAKAFGGVTFEAQLDRALDELRAMLIAKNKAYGNSALDPVRLFSQADAAEQIKVRIDDKISWFTRGEAAGEDVPTDLVGYFVLLLLIANRIAAERSAAERAGSDTAFRKMNGWTSETLEADREIARNRFFAQWGL